MHLSKPTFRIALLVGLAFTLLAGLSLFARPELLAADPPNQPFDLIYADPPYAAGLYGSVARAVRQGDWLDGHGLLLLECSSTALPACTGKEFEGWELLKQKRYGSSTVLMFSAAA